MNTLEKRNFTLNNKLLKIKNEKKKLLNNNKYDLALNFLKEEHRIESEINNNSFKIVNNNSKNKLLTEEIVNYVIEGKYYINIFEKNNIKKEKLFNSYKNVLKRKIINQDSVIDSFIDSIKYFYSIDYCEDKPFSFLFVGSNGVGKNTLANEIGKLLFNNVIKINFNEFVDEQSINKILGSSSGYVGYDNKKNLFESMKENPSSLIIMEDFDVACDSVKNLFYQILSKGYINESNGHKVIFNNCIFIIIKDTYDSINVGFDNSNNEDSICYKDKVDFILNFNKLNKSDIISILNNKIKGKKITISNMLLDKLIMESDYVKNGASKLDSLLDKYFYKVKI
jgi:ATP-dependent Clp protease ATP-binding subunit ClpA